MGQLNINLGTGYDTLDGDKLRDGGSKINANFTEVYTRATEWAIGTYYARTVVIRNDVLHVLASTVVLPFTSTDFTAEKLSGQWLEISSGTGGSGYFDWFAVFKKPGNTQTDTLEVGDIVQGFWDATEFWHQAIYNGGTTTVKSNYTILNSTEGL